MFSGLRTREFHRAIAPYVPACMEYKIHPEFRGGKKAVLDTVAISKIDLIPAKIISVDLIPAEKRKRTRFDISVEGTSTYLVDGAAVHNSPETTTGGRALKFYASVRLDIRRVESVMDGEKAIGNTVRVKVVKNKVAPPFRKVELEIIFGQGVNSMKSLLDAAVKRDLIEKAGSWYSYKGDRIGQGKNRAVVFLKEHPEIVTVLESVIRESGV